MCYNVTQLKGRILKEAKRYFEQLSEEEQTLEEKEHIETLEREYTRELAGDAKEDSLEKDSKSSMFSVSGFDHPKLLAITQLNPIYIQELEWGIIPNWISDIDKGRDLQNKTINARGETIFEKPSFKSLAKQKRCLIPVTGFFEHFHFGGKKYPFHITSIKDEVLSVAGLYDMWVNEHTGEEIKTFTIVTTKANSLLAKIHINPKLKEPRMPIILDIDKAKLWMKATTEEEMEQFLIPFPEEELMAFTVQTLGGKRGVGNTERALLKFEYPELQIFGF